MTTQKSLGVIDYHGTSARRTDYLYRVSLKCLIRNEDNEVLVVKEAGREHWDLPGGGMDHGENLAKAIAREMKEEVDLEGDFDFQIIGVEDPAHLSKHNFWQIRLIFEVKPRNMLFNAGEDGDQVEFKDPNELKESNSDVEQLVYTYSQKLA